LGWKIQASRVGGVATAPAFADPPIISRYGRARLAPTPLRKVLRDICQRLLIVRIGVLVLEGVTQDHFLD
jgi:hypothetical protein